MIRHKGGEKILQQKITKIFIPLLLLILTFICFVTTVSADPGIIYVNNATGNDSWDGQSATYTSGLNGPKLSIKNATGVVTSNGLVNIASGTYNEYNIAITHNMTLIGHIQNDTVINAAYNGQIFKISSGITLTLKNLTLARGSNTGFGCGGGAIYSEGTLIINNCKFFLNRAASGGAIYSWGTVIINDCTFESNEACGENFETAQGAAIFIQFGTLTVTNSIFIWNRAIGSIFTGGAAIFMNDGTLNLINSTFNNNYVESSGGLGAITLVGGKATITSSTFNNNSGNHCEGGAIHNTGTLTITNSTFNNNHVWDLMGGAIYNEAVGTLTIINSTLSNNYAKFGGSGGAIYNKGTAIINFNRIVNNENIPIANTGTANIDNNWWGTNDPDFTQLTSGILPPSSWVILSVNATPITINNNGTSTITADFNHINGGGDLTGGHIPDGPITLEILWGSLNNPGQHLITLNTVNGAINSVTFYANEGAINPLLNPVRVNATADGYTTNDSESAYIYINPVANLTINKIGPTVASAGTTITYTITIINKGIDPAEGVSLSDTMTSTNIFNTGTLQYRYKTNDDDWSSWTSFTNPLNLNLGTIINNKNATIEIRGTINASTTSGSIINNMATVSTTTTPGEETASIQTIMDTQTDLNVTKTGPENIIAGTQITYTITVENEGPSDAQNVVIVDIIPAILQNVSHDSFNLGTILAGESKTIYINGTIPTSTTKGITFQNTATVTSTTSGTITPSLLVTTTVDTLTDVDLNKTVNNTIPDVGDTVTFIVTAHNYGPSDATNIQIQDIMPEDFTNVNIRPSKGTYDIGTGIWTLNLEVGETATLNLTGEVTSLLAGKNTTNTATLMGTTNTTNATIYVPQADLYIQITSDKNNPRPGEIFTLTYKLGNNGPDDAQKVTITIPIPEGFVISEIKGDGNWTINGNTITWTFNKVTVGDPYLYISGWTTKAGTYLFSASIASNTFNLNSIGVNSFSINSQPQANAATTNTVGMQKTGAPLAGIVLAILMVLSGFIATRKKE